MLKMPQPQNWHNVKQKALQKTQQDLQRVQEQFTIVTQKFRIAEQRVENLEEKLSEHDLNYLAKVMISRKSH